MKVLRSFLLVGELGGTNVGAAQLDVEDTLHGGQDLLVGGSGSPLKVSDDTLGGVALGGQVLLGHLGLHLLTGLGDDVADLLAHGVGLDDVVGSIHLGQTLALDAARGLCLDADMLVIELRNVSAHSRQTDFGRWTTGNR
jgi:hypothetical protein